MSCYPGRRIKETYVPCSQHYSFVNDSPWSPYLWQMNSFVGQLLLVHFLELTQYQALGFGWATLIDRPTLGNSITSPNLANDWVYGHLDLHLVPLDVKHMSPLLSSSTTTIPRLEIRARPRGPCRVARVLGCNVYKHSGSK